MSYLPALRSRFIASLSLVLMGPMLASCAGDSGNASSPDTASTKDATADELGPDTGPVDDVSVTADDDEDGLTNAEEARLGTNPKLADTDGDSVTDKLEVVDPAAPADGDGDGKIDAIESDDDDADEDCLSDEDDGKDDVPAASLDPAVFCEGEGICNGAAEVVAICVRGAIDCRFDAVPGWEAVETICDGQDNDCNGQIDEGLTLQELPLGAPCVGTGLCGEGVVECGESGGLVCSSMPGGSAFQSAEESCNGLDDDCDFAVDEGFSVGEACDGDDLDLCTKGTIVCSGTGAVCDEATGDGTLELCNGLDDDCDGGTDEEFTLTMPCDGADADLCTDGTTVCQDGSQVCSDDDAAIVELCGNEVDDDCDGETDTDSDFDGDTYTACTGDCCDTAEDGCPEPSLTGPFAAEVLGNKVDDDCDGATDEQNLACDEGEIALDTNDPKVAVRAIGLCHESESEFDWGVLSARWMLPDGTPPPDSPNFDLGHGILDGFGPNVGPQDGKLMLAISSGTARAPTDPGYSSVTGFEKGYVSAHPPGFPKESSLCPGVITGGPRDGIGLEVTLRVPNNAYGFTFDYKFYTYEWPEFICSQYNDLFITLVSPTPEGLPDGNVAYDDTGSPMSVNNANLDLCTCNGGPPCSAGGKAYSCTGDPAEFLMTGFADRGGTSWLRATVPVGPGETIKVSFIIYDSGDGILDSTALIDNLTWISNPGVLPKTEFVSDVVTPTPPTP